MKTESGFDVFVSSSPSVSAASRASRRIGDMLGLACLMASLILVSTGVRTVQAEDDAQMSVEPQRVATEIQEEAAKVIPPSVEASAIEIEPGVVVLNTRGFNYGPPAAPIDPAAMRAEKNIQPAR